MKKIIYLFTIALLFSCSKDDGNISVTYQNLAGTWKFKSVVKADGTTIPYVGLCPSKQDYVTIFAYRKITTFNYNQDCINTQDWGFTDYGLDANGFITPGGSLFDEGTVTHLTKSGFRIEFAEPKDLNFMISVHDAKVIIFEKKLQ